VPDDEAPDTGQDPVERLLDLCVYAPLGFVVDARRVVPDLAQRGRAQATMARLIGEFAVTWGNTKLQEALAGAQEQAVDLLQRLGVASPERDQAPGAPSDAPTPPPVPGPGEAELDPAVEAVRSAESAAEAAALAIPDYDNLSASQVVPRLDGLTSTELEAVRRYERRHRHRKTILNRIAQLQSGSA
jgi:hypothetical protein